MTAVASVEIKGCVKKYRFTNTIVDLNEPEKIGLHALEHVQFCDRIPSGIVSGNFVNLTVRNLGTKYDKYQNLIADVSIECPETRCPFHEK